MAAGGFAGPGAGALLGLALWVLPLVLLAEPVFTRAPHSAPPCRTPSTGCSGWSSSASSSVSSVSSPDTSIGPTGGTVLDHAPGPPDLTFTATLGKIRESDTWTCVRLPDSAAVPGTAVPV